MRIKTMNVIRVTWRWIDRLLAVRVPMAAASGFRTR